MWTPEERYGRPGNHSHDLQLFSWNAGNLQRSAKRDTLNDLFASQFHISWVQDAWRISTQPFCMIPEESLAARVQIDVLESTLEALVSKSFAHVTLAHIAILSTVHFTTLTWEMDPEVRRACGT